MKIIRRFIYLVYYFRELDYQRMRKFRRYASKQTGRSGWVIGLDALASVFRYNISINDYYYFRFFQLSREDRKKWAGTGYMYEYQLRMNPKGVRQVLENKILFLERYSPFFKRGHFSLNELTDNPQATESLLSNSTDRLVLKNSLGQVGAQVEVVSRADFNPDSLLEYMRRNAYDLAEEYVVQHPALMALSPTGLNTLRIFTQLHEGEVELLGARLRVSVNSPVDNMGAGNLAAAVDIPSGVVSGPGVYSDITKQDQEIHPITGKSILGFKVPFWEEAVSLARSAALHQPENRSVGWDIAITEQGPELIEGNHNWCKLLWQLPAKQGLKAELERFS